MDKLQRLAGEPYRGIYEEVRIVNKPPLGIKPRFIWEEERIIEIKSAVFRYTEADRKVPVEWIEEYNDLVSKKK